MIRASVFPHSRSGLVAGILIGLGRALGETIAVALVIGGSPHISRKLFSAGYTLRCGDRQRLRRGDRQLALRRSSAWASSCSC